MALGAGGHNFLALKTWRLLTADDAYFTLQSEVCRANAGAFGGRDFVVGLTAHSG
jgi:hypothetical protein